MTTRVVVEQKAPDGAGHEVQLSSQESHYTLRVRRLKTGAPVIAMDGRARQWAASVSLATPRKCTILLEKQLSPPSDLPVITLLVGRPDIAAALDLLTGACELGVKTIGFINTARSQRHGPSSERITRTIQAAMRQCGRFSPPDILHFATLEKALHFESHHPCVFGDVETREESGPPTVIPSPPCRVAVGPEGGWTGDEHSMLTAHGASPVQLSPWVLRTPTAALAIVAKSFSF